MILIQQAPITGSVKKIDRWNSFTKASNTTFEIQASYPLNTMDMATSGLKLKGTQKPPHCVHTHEQEVKHKELRIVKMYFCT